MPILKYISDENLRSEVYYVIDKAISSNNESEKKFGKNVIDPFAAIFEVSGFEIDHKTWKASETVRQSQKSLQNHVGAFHQKILGHANNWEDKGVGGVVDLVSEPSRIIAEVKNKHNTVTGGKLANVYYQLEKLIAPKTSIYKDYTAYFVNIIPKKPIRTDLPFTPSDPDKGEKCPENRLIRIIDGASFYEIVTNEENALESLYNSLPSTIEEILHSDFKRKNYKIPDTAELSKYFTNAFVGK